MFLIEIGKPKYGINASSTPKTISIFTLYINIVYSMILHYANHPNSLYLKYSEVFIDIQSSRLRITDAAFTAPVVGPASIIIVKTYLGFS